MNFEEDSRIYAGSLSLFYFPQVVHTRTLQGFIGAGVAAFHAFVRTRYSVPLRNNGTLEAIEMTAEKIGGFVRGGVEWEMAKQLSFNLDATYYLVSPATSSYGPGSVNFSGFSAGIRILFHFSGGANAMTLRNVLLAATAAVLCCTSGCSYLYTYREIDEAVRTHTQKDQRPLIVITHDGSEYRLVGYDWTDSTLKCTGRQTAPIEQEFAGRIRLDSVEYLYLKEGDFFKSVVFAALTGSVVSLASTALQDKDIGLVAHDVISYPTTEEILSVCLCI